MNKRLQPSELEADRVAGFNNRDAYWRGNLRITGLLLTAWFAVTFVVSYNARALEFSFFGWPFSFWMAAQGSLLVYCAIIWFYARIMGKLDLEHGFQEDEE